MKASYALRTHPSAVFAMLTHLIIWKINNFVINAVAVTLFGLFVGPTFPHVLDIVTNPNTKHEPRVC